VTGQEATERKHTRRGFLDLVLGTAAVGWVVSVVYPILRYLKPLPSTSGGGPIHLTSDEVSKLDSQKFVIVSAGTKRVLVLEDAQQKLHALNARCTHEGCTVQFVPAQGLVWCACHNGKFDVDGHVLSGPPPRPLTVYPVSRDEEGDILIVQEKA